METYNLMKIRARHTDNDRQHDRMVKDKLKSLHRALLYSYQGTKIWKDGANKPCRALMNPDKIKFDYDEKIVSVDFKNDIKPGDSFEWPIGSGTHWLVLKQELTEIAYFRGSVRRCQEIKVLDPNTQQEVSIWSAIRGPVETKIDSIQKAGIIAHVPNHSLHVYMPKTDFNTQFFTRYTRFKFADRYWMIEAWDDISTPGILEFTAVENYECHGDEQIIETVDPNPPVVNPEATVIIGDSFVKPLQTAVFRIDNIEAPGVWEVQLESDNKDVEDILEWKTYGDTIEVKWKAMVSGSYVLSFGNATKTVVVESLF